MRLNKPLYYIGRAEALSKKLYTLLLQHIHLPRSEFSITTKTPDQSMLIKKT